MLGLRASVETVDQHSRLVPVHVINGVTMFRSNLEGVLAVYHR